MPAPWVLADQSPNVTVHQQQLDVADRHAFIAYADTVASGFGVVHQVYNNAGIASGKTVTNIADELSLSVKTISTYRVRILEKLRMNNNAEITRYAIKEGLVD